MKKFSNLRGLDLAKEMRINGYICPTCGAILRQRSLPISSYYKMAATFVTGILLAIPADFLWQLNLYFGATYLLIIIIGFFSSMYFWVLPRHYRQQPLEQVSE